MTTVVLENTEGHALVLIHGPTVSLILFMHGCTTATPNRLCVCASTNILDMQLYPLDRQALSGMLTCKDSPILRA